MLVIKRRAWIVVACVGVAVAIALLAAVLRTPRYQSSATLVYQKQTDVAAALGTASSASTIDIERELNTSAQLITGNTVAKRAAEYVEGTDTAVSLDATAVEDTNAIAVEATSTDANVAALAANAYARAFVEYKLEQTVQQLRAAEQTILKKMANYDSPSQRQQPAYLQLLATLQDVRVLASTATGNYRIAEPAVPATSPYTPKPFRDAILALVVGLLGGIAIAFVAEQLDVRVHTVEDLGDLLSLPVLARLPRPTRDEGKEHTLAVAGDPTGPSAEAFRVLRSNLEFVAVDGDLKSILFTSARQGEGKTTTTGNLALMLARAGKRVVVADCDLRRPRIHTYFGLPNKAGVSSVLTGHGTLATTVQKVAVPTADEVDAGVDKVEGREFIAVLTAGPVPPNPGEIVASQRLRDLLATLAADCDVLLIDCPPFLAVGDAAALARSVSGVIIVSRMGVATRTLVRETRRFIEPLPTRTLGLVVTNVAGEDGAYRYRYRSERAGEPEAPVGGGDDAVTASSPAAPPVAQEAVPPQAEPFSDPVHVADDADPLRID